MSLNRVAEVGQALMAGLGRVVVGQRAVLEGLVVALLADGHVLLEGAPGTAKTLMVHALARAVSGSFKRVQFTPDLMPADVLGTYVLRPSDGSFVLREGPIFTDLLLADEINRAPPRTQAALLEAMQERQVTLDGHLHPLSTSFFVVATQNPLEYEGTYPLPEAQLDRFLFKLNVDYPSASEEVQLLSRVRDGEDPRDMSEGKVSPVVSPAELVALRASLAQVTATDQTLAYISEVVRATRRAASVSVGAGPRASVALFIAARARAALHARSFVTPDDVKALAPAVLRHRLILKIDVALDAVDADQVIAELLASVEVPR